ncbi:MAG: flavin reductase [Candidatus Omnitrophota bacterium]
MDPNVLHNIGYGMYIVSSFKGDKLNGQIVNTLFQITSSPITIGISINKENLTHDYIETSKKFSASILIEDTPLNFIGKFGFKSGRDGDKFKDIEHKVLDSGCPVVLDHSLGYIEAKVINKLDCFTHTLFIGEMSDARVLKIGKALTYDYYHQVKQGTTPRSAPTFIEGESQVSKDPKMQRYRCTVCGYIYDPVMGDPDSGIQPGTPFEEIPDTWKCPICMVGKDKFVKED